MFSSPLSFNQLKTTVDPSLLDSLLIQLSMVQFPYCTGIYKTSSKEKLYDEFQTRLESWKEDKFLFFRYQGGGIKFYTAPISLLTDLNILQNLKNYETKTA